MGKKYLVIVEEQGDGETLLGLIVLAGLAFVLVSFLLPFIIAGVLIAVVCVIGYWVYELMVKAAANDRQAAFQGQKGSHKLPSSKYQESLDHLNAERREEAQERHRNT